MENERIAILDLGTNTFHLLIIEKEGPGISIVYVEKMAVKIGQGGINKNFIASDAYDRAIKSMRHFRSVIDKHKTTKVYATATSAFRNARNGYQLAKDIQDQTGIEVQIIPGDLEAQLIYEGVTRAMDLGKSTSVIIDIGGGSVELIICNSQNLYWKHSFEIGAQRVLDLVKPKDPVSPEDTQKIIDYFDDHLQPFFEAALEYRPVTLVGASGAFETISEIDILRKGKTINLEVEKEYSILFDSFEEIFFEIINKNREERLQMPGMIELRVEMIVIAVILVYYIASKLDIKKVRASGYALKEGVLYRLLEGKKIE